MIETVRSPENTEISFCPERGGIITSMKLRGREVLYLDQETFQNRQASIRGGIPILFPNAGIVESSAFPGLKRHGFARDSADWKAEKFENGFLEKISSSEEILAVYSYKFVLSVEGTIEENGSITISQKVQNLEEEKDLPVATGLHPYFKVPHLEKKNIVFNFEGGRSVEEQFDVWVNGGTVFVDNPKLKDPSAVMEITLPGLGILVMDVSVEHQKIWIWSMPEKDFICIEPVMRGVGGLIDDPGLVRPGETFSAKVNFNLK